MSRAAKSKSARKGTDRAPSLLRGPLPWLILASVFWHSAARVETSLRLYHTPFPFTGTGSPQHLWWIPGGPAEFAGIWLAQLDRWDLAGAAVLTLLGTTVFVAIRALLALLRQPGGIILALAPVFLMAGLQAMANSAFHSNALRFLAALVAALGYAVWTPAHPRLRTAFGVALAIPLFYLCGSQACIGFLLLAAVIEWLGRGSRACALAYAALILVCILWITLSPSPFQNRPGLPPNPAGLLMVAALFCVLPFGLAVLTTVRSRFSDGLPPRVAFSFQAIALVALAALAWICVNPARQALWRIGRWSDQGEWERILTQAKEMKQTSAGSTLATFRALWYSGRLGEDLFAYPLHESPELFPGLAAGTAVLLPQAQLLFELGQLNIAEHFAHEALEAEGLRPPTLELLTGIHTLNGRPEAARIFIGAWERLPFQKAAAARRRDLLDHDPHLASLPEAATALERRVKTDLPATGLISEPALQQCLHDHPTNKMAFEFLMTHYLLSLQADKVVAELPALSRFGYPHIPRHYEEALLLNAVQQGGQPHPPAPYTIRPQTRARFDAFAKMAADGIYKTPEGRAAMQRDFGDTLWFYHLARQLARPPASTPQPPSHANPKG